MRLRRRCRAQGHRRDAPLEGRESRQLPGRAGARRRRGHKGDPPERSSGGNSAPIASSRSWARGEWARSIAPTTASWAGTSPSRHCPRVRARSGAAGALPARSAHAGLAEPPNIAAIYGLEETSEARLPGARAGRRGDAAGAAAPCRRARFAYQVAEALQGRTSTESFTVT